MSDFFELPKVGEPKWFGTQRDCVEIDGVTYSACLSNADIQAAAKQLARRIKAQDFVAAELEKSRLDCAGERAYNACYNFPAGSDLWEHLTQSSRTTWLAVAKAVLDGEH